MKKYLPTGYFLFVTLFFVIKQVLEVRGIEYRLWVTFLGYGIIWCVPVFFMGYLLAMLIKKKRGNGIVLFVSFITYLFAAVLASAAVFILGIFNMKEERVLEDGSIEVRVSDFPNESITYYCDPISIFARKEFIWTPERDARLLEAKYQTPFLVVTQKNGEKIICSKEEPEVIVQLWNKSPTQDNYITNFTNAMILKTIEEYQIKTPFFDPYDSIQMGVAAYTFICESKEDAEEVSQTIATVVGELMKQPIFEKYGETLFCRLNMKLGYSDIFFELGNRPLQGQDFQAMDYYGNAEVVLDKLLEYYEEVPEVYSSKEVEELPEAESREYAEDKWLEEVYETIYREVFEKEGKTLTYEYNAKGHMYVSFGMEEAIRNTLVYDRESKNGKCYLVAYYEEHYDEDGNRMDNTSIKNYYAVVKSSAQVIASGKTAWADVGTKEYRQATGE